jgi:hypothetical protein
VLSEFCEAPLGERSNVIIFNSDYLEINCCELFFYYCGLFCKVGPFIKVGIIKFNTKCSKCHFYFIKVTHFCGKNQLFLHFLFPLLEWVALAVAFSNQNQKFRKINISPENG